VPTPGFAGRAAAVLVGVVVSVAAPATALAHGEASPLIRGVVDRVEPALPGVRFETVRGPAALFHVVNATEKTIEIVAIDGRPFLRIGPRGVRADVASRAWFESGNPDGVGRPGVKPDQKADWRLVSKQPEWSYFEHRLHPREARLPKEAQGSRKKMKLDDFVVPIRADGRPAKVEGHLEFRPVVGTLQPTLTSSAEPVSGVSVTVLAGRFPGLYLRNSSRRSVTILGRDGEPFARIGPRGTYVNEHSPVHVETLRHQGKLAASITDPDARPKWSIVSSSPSFAWTEPRIRYQPEQPPDEIANGNRSVKLLDWKIPMRIGSRDVDVTGSTRWVPVDASGLPRAPVSGDGAGSLILLLVGSVVVVGFAAGMRLRRRPSALAT
jgi:hypothetical protein